MSLTRMARPVLLVTASPTERRSRMRRMREHVREHNIYSWAGLLVAELAKIPEGSFERQ